MNGRKTIGSALWLLTLLGRYVPATWDGIQPAVVANGNTVSDRELADRLGVKPATVAKWRKRLCKAGVLHWHLVPKLGRIFYLHNLEPVLAFTPSTSQQQHIPIDAVRPGADQRGQPWQN